MAESYGFQLRELSPGGGWGVAYSEKDRIPSVSAYLRRLCRSVIEGCAEHGLALPILVVEPGRSIVARAAVALYRVGARKVIPGVRTYVSLDGGMADNIRPALYGTRHMAVVADTASGSRSLNEREPETVTLAGKFCESGDMLIWDIKLPRLEPGDLVAVPVVGAYGLALAGNYNLSRRPAVLLVNDGRAHLIQRRETHADLLRRDLPMYSAAGSRIRSEPS
jgi:diaminopimelate decarboxylase